MSTSTVAAPTLRPGSGGQAFDVAKIRADFPILSEIVHGKPLVYLDSANTSQKPLAVISATDNYYRHANANIHRATHLVSERATALYEGREAEVAAAYPLGRLGHPDDVASAVAFLASDDAAWVTGQTLTLDGGLGLTGGV